MELKDPKTGEVIDMNPGKGSPGTDGAALSSSEPFGEGDFDKRNTFKDTQVTGPGGAITGAPLEGNVRENPPNKTTNVDRLISDSKKSELVDGAETGPLAGGELLSEAQREARETLVSGATAGRLSESNKELKAAIEEKLENKSAESVKKDLHEELAHPPVGGAERHLDPSRTVQRPDGTITTADRPNETAHYIHGSRMMLNDEQKAKLDALTKDMNDSADGLTVGDIPLDNAYWQKKKELDAYVAKLKR